MQLDKIKIKEIIARRIAEEFKDGEVVTLGIGLPTEVVNYIPNSTNVIFQSENGFLGAGKTADIENADKKIVNAGGVCVETQPGACFYDTQMALTLMRGGHIDATVLGALQVDQEGSIANWSIPDKFTPGMGGAMDLVVGAKRVIVAMEHMNKEKIKIVKKCNLPLTGYKEVNLIVTERCVLKVTDKGLVLTDINPIFSVDDIRKSVEAEIIVSADLKKMQI